MRPASDVEGAWGATLLDLLHRGKKYHISAAAQSCHHAREVQDLFHHGLNSKTRCRICSTIMGRGAGDWRAAPGYNRHQTPGIIQSARMSDAGQQIFEYILNTELVMQPDALQVPVFLFQAKVYTNPRAPGRRVRPGMAVRGCVFLNVPRSRIAGLKRRTSELQPRTVPWTWGPDKETPT